MSSNFLFLIHFISTIFMTGVIWIVQLVHYPSFFFISEKKFIDFEKFHRYRISLIVLPVMIIEIFSGFFLAYKYPGLFLTNVFISSLIILLVIWATTFGVSVRMHEKLSKERNLESIRVLVQSNWVRTLGWSLRLILLSFLFNLD